MSFSLTPESEAAKLESLAGRPSDLREMIEAKVLALLRNAEISARFCAVVMRRIREKELWRSAGWPSWDAFAGYFLPEDPHRLDLMIDALEVLEAKGDKRDFKASEVAEIVKAAAPMPEQEIGKGKAGPGKGHKTDSETTRLGRGSEYLAARLKRDAPDIAAAAERGEYRSIRAAAMEAGIIKAPDAYHQLCNWWRKATPEQRDHFENYIAEWRRREAA